VKESIDIPLGTASDVADLLSWDSSSGTSLTDWVAHGFNQTFVRDLYEGSWAEVYADGEQLRIKITSPRNDVSPYERSVPAFLDAGRIALGLYKANEASIAREKLFYYLPVGMSLAQNKSVQLLHYPPYEARTFFDYLYSPTNRRCESLWGFNGFDTTRNTLLERIVDVVPLAGPGGNAEGIAKFESTFVPYAKAMLAAVLDDSRKRTQPVVAYGGPMLQWLQEAFGSQIHGKPGVLSLLMLNITGKAETPLLCANHPSLFLYFDKEPKEWATTVMRQDLIAFGWQARMSEDWHADPARVLSEVTAYWDRNKRKLARIVAEQEEEFGWGTSAVAKPT
jgi:hypothetical protein